MRIAEIQGKSLQECRELTPSNEFFLWMAYFEWCETEQRTKQDYYMAQIAAEIRVIRQMFAKNPKKVSIEECILTLKKEEGKLRREKLTKIKAKTLKREKVYETGPELVKDPKWAAVNEAAKARWAAWLGPEK